MKKVILTRIISLILALSLFAISVGCKKDKADTKNPTPDSNISSSDNNESTDSNDANEDENNSTDEFIDIDMDLDMDMDLFDDLGMDFTIRQTVVFDSVSEQKNYVGMAGVLPCFWFLPDETMPQPYTEEQLSISIKKFLQMGVTVVRCHLFTAPMAWDGENDKWDWDSEWMKGFYEYCDLMKENGIEIVLNPPEVTYKTTAEYGLESPFPVLGKQLYPEIFANYSQSDVTEQQKDIILDLYGEWIVDFYEEVVVKRGYDNIAYLEPATEPNVDTYSLSMDQIRVDYEKWLGTISTFCNALEKAGYRDKFTIVGPSIVVPAQEKYFNTAYTWLKWCVDEIDHMIDIYAVHQYYRPSDMTQDVTYQYETTYIEPCMDIIKSTGKPLWCDEFHIGRSDGAPYPTIREDSLQATQLACAYINQMAAGIKASFHWYLTDIKWPNNTTTTPVDSWEDGIHKCGLDTSVLDSVIPSNAYYVFCMLGETIQNGDTVYKGVAEYDGLYSIMLEHKDGTYSFITVNLGWGENEITYKLPKKLKNVTFEKTVYDPTTFKATTQYKLIESSKEIKNVSDTFTDKVGSYQVCVYNIK